MIGLATVAALLSSIYFSTYLYKFAKNYINASRSGLPFFVMPVDQQHVLWMICSVVLRPWLKKYLPSRLYDRFKYAIYGWEHGEKLSPYYLINHGESAEDKSFLLVSFGSLEFITASPQVASQILLQPRSFQQLEISKLFIGIYGTNVLTADGDEWSKHRKIVASAVTERVSPVVWTESVKQTTSLIEEVCGTSDGEQGGTVRFYDMMKTVTIHVLSRAGMGVAKDWVPKQADESGNDADVSYMDAVKLINDYLTGPIIIPTKALLNWPSFLPGYPDLRRLGLAKDLFPVKTKEMLTEEKQRLLEAPSSAEQSKANLMSMLLVASDSATEEVVKEEHRSSTRKLPTLTDDELVSNLYVFTAAGYDTTANTIAYAFTLLMRYPRWQEWLFEDIDRLFEHRQDLCPENIMGNYQAVFPKCTRIMALMLETLRIFTPVVHLAKMVKQPQPITTDSGKEVVIPAGSTVYVHCNAIHLDAKVWRDLNLTADDNEQDWEADMPGRHGATPADFKSGGGKLGDEWRFRPTRWINRGTTLSGNPHAESLFQPPRGTFVPWSMGPRVCPGQKMAQVEFTAILLTVLSRYRVEAIPVGDESADAVNERLDWTMENSISKLTLEMAEVYGQQESGATDSKKGLKVRLVKRV